MTPREEDFRLGAVSYLNTLPLIETLGSSIYKDVPANLIHVFNQGVLDAALLPIYDIFQLPDPEVVQHIAIAARGDVYSVILAYQGALEKVRQVSLDPSSHTSNQLVKVILAEFYSLYPHYIEEKRADGTLVEGSAKVIIGDPALHFRQQASCSILDLGGAWYHFTKLPFVFAMWCLNKKTVQREYLKKMLLTAKEEGLRLRNVIAAREPNPALALYYLTKCIHYDVGPRELEGITLFKSLLKKHALDGGAIV